MDRGYLLYCLPGVSLGISRFILAGIGYTRFQGDRDYEYVFPFGDKEFRVSYSVYGSDPRNLSATVDEIVRTATLVNSSPADL